MAGRGIIPVLTSGQATPPKPYLGMLLKAQKIVRAWDFVQVPRYWTKRYQSTKVEWQYATKLPPCCHRHH